MHDEFARALFADARSCNIPLDDDIYCRLIGEWDFEWVDHKGTPE